MLKNLFFYQMTYVKNGKEYEKGIHNQGHNVGEGRKCKGHLQKLKKTPLKFER